jgi:hypothetical protein
MEINLNNINNNLLKCIDDIHKKKIVLDHEINEANEEKNQLEMDIKILQNRYEVIITYLESKKLENNYYDKKIGETEEAYSKICKNSQILLNVLNPEDN